MRFRNAGRLLLVACACLWTTGCPRYAYLANTITPVTPAPRVRDLSSRSELLILVFGDSGTGGSEQESIGAEMVRICGGRCDFALVLGDNIYNSGVTGVGDQAFRRKFERSYAGFGRIDFWVVPGNHDWHRRGSVQAQVDYSNSSDRWRMPFNHYVVPNLPEWVTLYGLDTTVMYDRRKRSEPDRKQALAENEKQQVDAALKALQGRPGWRLLFGHHPVYTTGDHGYEDGGVGVLPFLRESVEEQIVEPSGVAIYFAGHDHDQELLHSPNASYYQVVQGAAGKLRPVKGPVAPGIDRKFACAEYGFALARATADSMQLTYYGCGRNGVRCREIYAAKLTLSGGAIRFEQIHAPTCQSGPAH